MGDIFSLSNAGVGSVKDERRMSSTWMPTW